MWTRPQIEKGEKNEKQNTPRLLLQSRDAMQHAANVATER